MGRHKISIDETRRMYVPMELVEDGFKGDCEAIADYDVFLVKRPQSDWKRVKESLKSLVHDIDRRIEEEDKNGSDSYVDEKKKEKK